MFPRSHHFARTVRSRTNHVPRTSTITPPFTNPPLHPNVVPKTSTFSSSQPSRALPRQAVTDLIYDLRALEPPPLGLTNGVGIASGPVGTEQPDVERHFDNEPGLVKMILTSRRGVWARCAGCYVSPRYSFAAGTTGLATGNGVRESGESA